MVYLWLLIAFVFMAFLIWRDAVQAARRTREIEELRDLREDLENIRDEVHLLIEHLDTAADAAVEKFSAAVSSKMQGTAPVSPEPVRTTKPKKSVRKPVHGEVPADNTILFPRISPETSAKHQMVYFLAEQGCSEDEIAQKMNIGKGEVSLILQLQRKVIQPKD